MLAAAATKLSLVLVISILAAPWASDAQPTKVARVGFLSAGVSSDPAAQHNRDVFRQGLRELGYVEGQNVVLEYRSAEGELDRLSALAGELVRLKVDVIVAGPAPPAVAAKNATGTIPIVMWGVGDPVGLGLIASLARPGGNVTGLSFGVGMDHAGKGLELLREAVPKARRRGILSNPAAPNHALAMSTLRATARSLEVQLRLLEARGPSDFDGAFAAMKKDRVTALFVLTDALFYPHRARLADLAAEYRLPSMHGVR